MNICIARHNGLGDIIMAVPFIGHYLSQGHKVTVQCAMGDHEGWLKHFFPYVQVENCEVDPYTDFRRSHPRYDVFLNFNRVEMQDDMAFHHRVSPVNWQHTLGVLALTAGLEAPPSLAPGDYVQNHFLRPQRDPGSKRILLFTRATNPSRSIGPNVVQRILAHYQRPRVEIAIDPHFGTKLELFRAISQCDLVLAPDSGTIHVAEMMRVKWACFHTTFDHLRRHLFYKYGHQIPNTNRYSPCFRHGWCGNCSNQCVNTFNLELLPPLES